MFYESFYENEADLPKPKMRFLPGITSIYWRLTRFFTENLTRMTIALFGFITFVAISWGTYDVVSMLSERSASLANETQTERNDSLLRDLTRLQQQIRTDVVQVQQSVTDYSATRAQDGHNNGLRDAAQYAKRFQQDIGAAKRAAEALDSENIVNASLPVAQLFPDWYARGVEMAKIYTAEGPSAGNRLMDQFSPQSEEMQKRLDEADSALDALRDSVATSAALGNKRIREARDKQSLISLGGVLATALTSILGAFLAYYRVIQPLSWITHCFKSLEKSEFHYDVQESRRADEIGALGKTYREFKELALENRKNSLQANLLSQFNEWLHCCKSLDELYDVVALHLTRLLPNCGGTLYLFSDSRNVLDCIKAWSGAEMAAPMHPDDCWGLRRGRAFSHWQDDIEFHCAHVNLSTPSDTCCIPILAHGETIGLLHFVFGSNFGPRLEKILEEQRNLAINCAEQISIAIANLKLRDQLRDQSIRDPLTGLFNRRYLLESCRREFARAARAGQHVSLLSIDVDHFKKYNDNHGHDAGDMVLRVVGECLRNGFRKEDIPCRFGGEEFIVVLPGATPADAVERADKLRGSVESLVVRYFDRNLPQVSISVGVATFPDCGDNPEALIKAADEALYRAKENGRNRVEASSLLGLPSGVATLRSVLLRKALEEDCDFIAGSVEAAIVLQKP
jgi:diguanylate cyclase (GGDEF)-like protein